jgi:hypothetical protein
MILWCRNDSVLHSLSACPFFVCSTMSFGALLCQFLAATAMALDDAGTMPQVGDHPDSTDTRNLNSVIP